MNEKGLSRPLPEEGVSVAASEGNRFTRINLDLADDGITLAMVGAASAALKKGNRQMVTLKPSQEGVVLSVVGAATAAR